MNNWSFANFSGCPGKASCIEIGIGIVIELQPAMAPGTDFALTDANFDTDTDPDPEWHAKHHGIVTHDNRRRTE